MKTLQLSKLKLSILIALRVLGDNDFIAPKGIIKYIAEQLQTDKAIIDNTIQQLINTNFIVKDLDSKIKLNNTNCRNLIMITKNIDNFILDRLINNYISLSTLRLYLLLLMKAYPHLNDNLRITYNEMIDSYNYLFHSDIDSFDLNQMLDSLIDEKIIIKHRYNKSVGDGYYNEYEFINVTKILKDIGLI